MRLGVIADVHGNLTALEAVLDQLRREGVDAYACGGDLVGYGPQPNECVGLIAELGATCVAGNHDLMALDLGSAPAPGTLAQRTLDWVRSTLTAESREFLAALPRLATPHSSVLMAHGSLESTTEYVRDADAAARQLRLLAARAPDAMTLLLGHTHHPLAYGSQSGSLRPRPGGRRLRPHRADERWVLNPGSVGQPRERRPLSRFLVLETDGPTATFHAITYDEEAVAAALATRGLPPDACHMRPRPVRRGLVRLRDRLRRGS